MKTQILIDENPFVPVTIALTFESQDELDRMGKLFNCRQVHNYLNMGELWNVLKRAGAHLDANGSLFVMG